MELGNLSLRSPKCFFFLPRFPLTPVIRSYQNIPKRYHKSTTITSSSQISGDKTVARRSANYKPNIWDFSFLELLKSGYTGEIYEKQSKKLQETVRHSFNDEEMTTLARLELIDTVERLGIGYLFKNEIKRALDNIVNTINQLINLLGNTNKDEDLHATSLQFRLLRQHGYEISHEVFACWMKDIEMGNWKTNIDEDVIKGMLSLYEASHLAFEGETILHKAKALATKYLNKAINEDKILSPEVAKRVKHSLELPLHWRMQRLEARWYIDHKSVTENTTHGSDLLELAKLDYNMLQAIYQNDLREMSSWCKNLGFDSDLSFARNRLMENFFWTVGGIYEPQLNYCRKGVTKLNVFLTTIDDVYDVYGTLDELELFTDIVERWDINAMDQLPNYMKICFLGLYNNTNEIAYDILKETHWNVIKYLKQTWADLCRSFLIEAKWYHNKYTPTLDEYLNNAWISVAGPAIIVHAYFLTKQEVINKEALDYLQSYPDIIRRSSMICRLCNDLATSTAEEERGDSPTSIQCYMLENKVSEDVAREYIRNLINEIWKQLNKDVVDSSTFSQNFTGSIIVNMARVAQCMYQYGDGLGVPDRETKDKISLVLFDSISLQIGEDKSRRLKIQIN